MKRSFALVLMALLAAVSAALAQGPDDQYVRIYNLIQEGDLLNNSGQNSPALAKYLEAQTALQRFQRGYPDWNVKVVSFRVNYLAGKVAELSPRNSAPRVTTPSPTPPPPAATLPATVPAPAPAPRPAVPPVVVPAPAIQPAAANDFQEQLNALKDQVRQLQVDKTALEAKLKEAFSAQPAAVDPRELTKAQEQAKSLQKENDLLKVTLEQEKAKPAAADPKVLAQTQLALAEANRKLSEQTEKARTLAEEKQFLQNKLSVLSPVQQNAAALEETKKALADAKRQLAEQREVGAKLALEKEALQSRFRSMNSETDVTAALRAENQLLKKQLAEAKAVSPAPGNAADGNVLLAQAQAQIAALRSDKELLRLEKTALENKVKQMSATALAATTPATRPAPATAAPTAASKAEDAARIKQLEHERDDLQKKLEAAAKELYGRKGQAVAARVEEMENQLGTLRARLAVFEARQVPYSTEELALFKTPEPRLADPRAGRKSVKELPAGAEKFVIEAQKNYSNNQLDKAEENYQKVLRMDKKNVAVLANLANIQIDLKHLEAAETNIKQAIALAPEDAYSQMVLGRLRLQQEKFDEAIDALSRAAKLDPQDAQIQNFLGLALNEKGLRGPAETALRRAIQLDPGYPNAHNNLAVMYLTQQPPLVELARWHYQKALAGGFPRNPDLEKMIEVRKPIE